MSYILKKLLDLAAPPAMIPILVLLLGACGGPEEAPNVEIRDDPQSEVAVRPGVILSDTSLESAGPSARPSEALPGPGVGTGSLPPPSPGASPGAAPVPAPAPPSGAPAQPAPPTAPAPAPSAGWSTGTSRRGGGNVGVATLTGVRAGRNDGFDRIVFQFAGSAVPGYTIDYIDRPVRQCGSGNVVPLPGDAWLSIRMEPAQAHDEQGRVTVAQRGLSPGLPNVLQVTSVCDFEGQVEWVAGVRSPEGYRVSELRDPARLVVDVRH